MSYCKTLLSSMSRVTEKNRSKWRITGVSGKIRKGYFLRTARFWVITQRVVVIQGFLNSENGTDRLSRNLGKEITTTRCVITQKSTVLTSRRKPEFTQDTFWIQVRSVIYCLSDPNNFKTTPYSTISNEKPCSQWDTVVARRVRFDIRFGSLSSKC